MNAPPEAQGQAFARDVRRIRETQGVTPQEIHQATKIPKHLLQQFEVDALFSHDTFNQVYLRSVARSVADHINVDRKDMMDALEAALAGEYAGGLASMYLDEAPDIPVAPEAVDHRAPAEDAADVVATPSDRDAQAPDTSAPTPEHTDAPTARAIADQETAADDQTGTGAEEAEATPEAGEGKTLPDSTPAEVSTANAQAPAATHGAPRTKGAVRATNEKQPAPVRPRSVWPLVVGGAVVVAALILLIVALQSDTAPEPTPPAPAEVTPTDTIAEAAAPSGSDGATDTQDEASDTPQLGDTLTVEVVAAYDRVDPIRIRIDDDLRRPYWIEEGESRSFSAVDQIILENQLENIELRLDGVPVPTDERDAEGRIVITRERAERLLSENAPNT
ncbi:MAG: hypothetical protein GVY12_07560 [Bacteroidetes bacterium]|jgi:hypothetical protein|nr:hypothetical protein [Bacteroidota bacterium]